MLACPASTGRSTALDGTSLDTPSTCSIPPPPPSVVSLSAPELDPPAQSFPHRFKVVEGPVGQPLEVGDQRVGGVHAPGALDQGGPVGGEHRRLQVARQFGPGLDLV